MAAINPARFGQVSVPRGPRPRTSRCSFDSTIAELSIWNNSRFVCHAKASTLQGEDTVKEMKKHLFEMAGNRGGLDMTRDAKRRVVQHIQLFEGLGRPNPEAQDLRGTSWKLLFTDSESTSTGKFGPIIGTTGQVFPKTGQTFLNSVNLFGGLLRLELNGVYSAGESRRIDLVFKHVDAYFAGFKIVTKAFPPDFKAFWKMLYADAGLRIFSTNQGNVFALYNEEASGKVYTEWSRYDKSKFQ